MTKTDNMRPNFAELKRISIVRFLAHIGIRPVRDASGYALYRAPYRKDEHPSFKVNKSTNRWYDLAQGIGGDILDLGKRIYNTDNVFDVAQRIETFDCGIVMSEYVKSAPAAHRPRNFFKDVEALPLTTPPLISYLAVRGVDLEIALKYCVELRYRLNGKNYFAIGFKNVSNGYEVRNSFFKGCFGSKDISLIEQRPDNEHCTLFEGFLDFLSYLTIGKRSDFVSFNESMDFMVLNSVVNLQKAVPWLKKYTTVTCCLDNDDAGRHAVEVLSEMRDGIHDASDAYKGYKDLNDFLTHKRL